MSNPAVVSSMGMEMNSTVLLCIDHVPRRMLLSSLLYFVFDTVMVQLCIGMGPSIMPSVQHFHHPHLNEPWAVFESHLPSGSSDSRLTCSSGSSIRITSTGAWPGGRSAGVSPVVVRSKPKLPPGSV